MIARALAAGVGRMVTISTRVKRFAGVLEIAEAHRRGLLLGRHASAQCRPRSLTSRPMNWFGWPAHPKVVAIGEAGLDYHYDKSPRPAQAQGFRTHIAAATGNRVASGDPCARRRRRHCRHSRRRKREGGFPLHPALFFVGPPACRNRRRARRLRVLLRHPHLQELGRTARHRRRRAARPSAGRNRRALSGAGAIPWKTKRAVPRDQHGARARRNDRRERRRDRRNHDR